MLRHMLVVGAVGIMLGSAAPDAAQGDRSQGMPHLARADGATQLVVDGRPFLVLAGELGNSSGEPDYLRTLWPRLRPLSLNTILAPVYWELVEPAEGRFDFASLDGLIREAREHDVRLVLLWFASWKNSISCYAPAWVKTDTRRFPRSQDAAGRSLDILSPFSATNRDADARAFAALMRHVREVDAERHTVIMVQVENEIGMIPDVRDRSASANALFAQQVPAALLEHLQKNEDRLAPEVHTLWTAQGRRRTGTWEQVFGPGRATEEIFTAWHFAIYTEAVTSAGKAEYRLPMYTNAALIRPGYQPGQYPSGGPLPHLADVWRAGAPSLDFIAPDIYFSNFAEWCRRYDLAGNPLFIPEAQRGIDASVNAFYAIAAHDAIGFAPFGIESIAGPAATALADSYALLAGLAPTILAHQGRGTLAGVLPEGPEQRQPQQVAIGDCLLRVSYERAAPANLVVAEGGPGAAAAGQPMMPAGGLIIATGRDEFLLAGIGLTVTFAPAAGDATMGILSVEEGRFDDGKWVHVRWLNGDETHQGRHLRLEPGRFSVQKIKLYRYR